MAEPDAATKYLTPVRPSTPAWAYPATAVGLVLLAGLIGVSLVLARRRRTRGW